MINILDMERKYKLKVDLMTNALEMSVFGAGSYF
jgi:hypothetical protein